MSKRAGSSLFSQRKKSFDSLEKPLKSVWLGYTKTVYSGLPAVGGKQTFRDWPCAQSFPERVHGARHDAGY